VRPIEVQAWSFHFSIGYEKPIPSGSSRIAE
jgi:hypothetical protein